jgi:DDE superfamily endonuclease
MLHQALLICNYNIPAALQVNSDQTQVIYQQGSSMTYTKTGSTQVPMIGMEEKHSFTLNIGILASGVLLPFQAIYGGKSPKSLPNDTEDGFIKAQQLGFHFKFLNTDTYWSTLETMKQYVISILTPYFTSIKSCLSLEMDQECIWQIDVWPVHTSLEFQVWLHETHPYIIFDYVPGGCTGIFQPCDVGIQCILKQSIQKLQHAHVIKEVCDQLDGGTDAGDIILDTKLGALRNCSPHWLVNAYIHVNRPNIVLKVRLAS